MDAMDPPMQDEDIIWRRAFADSMGLFDNLSYGPLPTCPNHNSVLPSSDSMVQDPILASPQPGNINAALVPSPALDFILPVAQQAMLPCPTLVGSPMDELPPLAPHPAPSTVPGAVGGLGSSVRARDGVDAPVQEQSEAVSAAQAATRQASDEDAHQGGQQQRGGESFARKRDRAKLLRQQMNDGLDNLHKALVEISSSGANPSAAAATSLIPTRGPRRATVVACSAGLVRDLISTCVSLRSEKETLKDLLASAEASAAAAAAAAASGDAAIRSPPLSPSQEAEGDLSIGSRGGKKKRDGGGGARAGVEAAKVFGQLLALGVFGFLGPQSLEEGRRVSRDWRDKCTWDCCWRNLCASRWRLRPQERHAEVWRADKAAGEARPLVWPAAPPPTWRQIYGRLHQENRVPNGALSSLHMVIGKTCQEGLAVWIALSRRSNSMTGRSIMGHDSTGLGTTEVIELRAVVQRIEEGPAARLHPHSFKVRQVRGLRACLLAAAHGGPNGYSGGGSGGLGPYSSAVTTTAVFPSLPLIEKRFWPRFTLNTGAAGGGGGSSGGGSSGVGGGVVVAPPPQPGDMGTGLGSGLWGGCSRSAMAAAAAATPPLALNEFASVDFFIETPGCHTEADFLRLEVCVDIRFSAATSRSAEGERTLTVALTSDQHAVVVGLGAGIRRRQWAKR